MEVAAEPLEEGEQLGLLEEPQVLYCVYCLMLKITFT